MEAHLGEENVVAEEFDLAPDAFLGSQLISTFFMLLAVLLNISMGHLPRISPLGTTIAALVFSIGAVLLFLVEFVFGFELVDPLFKKKKSINVIGTLRKPGTAHVKQLLILSGHHDSAFEFTWLRLTGYGFFILNVTWLISLASVLVMNLNSTNGVITGQDGLVRTGTISWVLLIFPIAPSIIYAIFFTRGRENGGTVPGAADNLSACGLVVAMCKFLVNNPAYIPPDTEIRFITFGSEEAGVRG